MVTHKDIIGYVPIFQKLDVVYAKGDSKGGYYKKPVIALAIAKEDDNSSITSLVPMVSMNALKEIDIAHEENIIGYDDGSQPIQWKSYALKYDEKKKSK